jgi:hypothetical protein
MAINFGDVLGGLGAAYGGRAQEYAQGIQQREQGLTERKRMELEARQKAMYQDGYQAFQMLSDGNLDGIIDLANDRLEMLATFPDADPSDTLEVIRDAEAAKAGDPMAIRNLSMKLAGAAQTAQRMGLVPQVEAERGVVVGPDIVSPTTGRMIYQGRQETEPGFEIMTPEQVAAIPGLDPTRAYQQNMGTRQVSQVGGGGQNITVDTGGQRSLPGLEKMLDENFAAASMSAGARPRLAILSQLADITTEGQFQATLSRMLPTYNDANTAFTGIVNQILPSLRVPGSGGQSDRDLQVLEQSLGQLSASKETKQLLIQSFIQKDDLMQQKADITQKFYNGELSSAQAAAEIRKLDSVSIISPALQQAMDRIIPSGSQSSIPQSAVDAGVTPEKWSLMTPEERGGWK